MRIKAIMFDIDGTLVDSNDQHMLAWQEVFSNDGVLIDLRPIHDQIGKGTDMLVPALLAGADDDKAQRLGEAHGKIFQDRYLKSVQPFPGAKDLLARVHEAGKLVVLASSASKLELDHYLDLLGAREFVAATTSADDVNNTKPAPDIFSTALIKIGKLAPDEVLVVGDTPYDIMAAAECGIATVALRSGKFGDEMLRKAGPLCLYDNVAKLLADFESSPLNA